MDRGVGFCSVVAIAAHASVIALNMNCCAAPFTACARGPPLTRSSGASVGAGRCMAVRNVASASAAGILLVTGAMSAGISETHVVTIHGWGYRCDG